MNDHPSAKPTPAPPRDTDGGCRVPQGWQGCELLVDMATYRAKVAASLESARNWLMRRGVMTAGVP
jgi:hypothetical protein